MSGDDPGIAVRAPTRAGPSSPEAPRPEGSWARRVVPAALYQCAFLAAVALFKSAANATVVARFHAGSLPYLYVAAAGLTGVVTAAAAVVGRRRGRDPLVMAVIGTLTAAAVVAALWAGLSSSALLLYLFAETFTSFTSIVFWSAMSDAFDARESRRAFTIIAGVGMSGSILGGLLAQLLARPFGAAGLVAAAGGMLVLAAVAFTFHAPEAHHAAPARARHGTQADLWDFLRRDAYPWAIGGLVLAFAVISPFADFVFRQRAAQFLGENELAALFGNQQLWIGVSCALFQLVLAQRLLGWLGVVRYLGVVPGILAGFAVVALVWPGLWPAYALKLAESAASLSILPVGIQLLYAPVADELRDRVRALMDGLVKKGGLALGGVMLVGAGPWLDGPAPVAALVVVCLGAAVVLWRLKPAYVSALQAQVGDGAEDEPEPLDSSSEKLLASALRSPDPDRVLHALDLFEAGRGDLRPHLAELLNHESERVVARGVALAAEHDAVELAPRLEWLLRSERLRRPRIESAWALAKLSPARAARVLPAFLVEGEPGVKAAAIGALLKLDAGPEEPELLRIKDRARAALEGMTARGERAPLAERRELAKLLGKLADEAWAPVLARYLQDQDGSVRALAIRAVGEGRYRSLVDALLPCLMWRDDRVAAREALAAFGDAIVPTLEEALNDRSRPASLRYELPRVLRQIGSQAALDVLLFSNIRDDAFLHYRIGVSLSLLKEEHPELTADVDRVREAILRRRDTYRRYVQPFRDLRAALGEDALLTRAVGDRLDQALELSFWLLGLMYPPRTLRRVHEHLVGPDPRRRAYALELFENLVSEEDRELVNEQVYAHHRELPLGAPGRLADHLGFLCHSDDHVLRACAREVARRLGLWTLPPQEGDMSDTRVKRLFALEGVEIFAQSDVDEIAAVAQVAREHRFRRGERIYSEGDPGDALYVIISGGVDAFRRGEKVLSLDAKQAFGEVSLLDGSPRPTEMIAREDTEVLVIDRRDFLDLLADRPELLKGIFRVVSRQLREVVDLAANARKLTGEVPAAALRKP